MGQDDILELTIADVVYRGKGLARHDGMVVFIPGALTGEKVRVQVTKRRKNYAEADLLEILEASPERIKPVCPFYENCPGCCYQHVSYEEEVRIKNSHLKGFLRRLVDGKQDDVVLSPVPSPLELGYRNKIILHVGHQDDKLALGYVAEDNETVLDIDECPLAAAQINTQLKLTRTDEFFMGKLAKSRDVSFRCTMTDGVLVWADHSSPGKERLTEDTPWGSIHVPRRSFYQVNPLVANELMSYLESTLRELELSAAIDLYCGVGIFAFAAAMAGIPQVVGIDADDSAIRAACSNARRFELENLEFYSGTVKEAFGSALKDLPDGKTALIVDPPRRGLERDVIESTLASSLSTFLYISCAADTLARDIKLLQEGGFRVIQSKLMDMFPRTPYFESVTLLQRG